MELIYKVMPKDYKLVHASDLHYGPMCCFKEGIQDMVDYVKTHDDVYLWFSGDAIDAILPNDKRYAHCGMDRAEWLMSPQDQADKVIEVFEPIKERILGWQLGNHEYTVINSFDVAKYICKELEVPWGGVSAKFIARHPNNKPAHKFFFMHGKKIFNSQAKDPIQAPANQQAALKKYFENTKHTDCVYMGMGHGHKDILVEPTVGNEIMLTDDGNGELDQEDRFSVEQTAKYIPPECRWYAMSPGFLKTYTPSGQYAISYSEIAGYGPTRLGFNILKVVDSKLVDVRIIDSAEFHKTGKLDRRG